MKQFTPLEYLCIDIANHFGNDKWLFEERIKWVKDNINDLEDLADQAETKPLYIKAVHELREVMAGKPTGHIVQLDATCSGIQLLSAMAGCKKGADATGLVSNKRADAYTDVTRVMNEQLKLRGMSSITIPRPDVKQAMMTAVYGSTAEPKKVFGEGEVLDIFYTAGSIVAPAAFELMTALLKSWQPYALEHSWVLPDNHHVHVKVMQKKEVRIEVDELNHATFTTYVDINEGSEKGVANVANITHSVDAYVLRSVIRRASYNVNKAKAAFALLRAERTRRALAGGTIQNNANEDVQTMIDIYQYSGMRDVSIADYLDEEQVKCLPLDLLLKLYITFETMLELGSSPVVPVHDSFGSLPTHCNAVRYWYKELCAELAESNMLSFLFTQVTGKRCEYIKKSNDLGDLIRQSNYALS